MQKGTGALPLMLAKLDSTKKKTVTESGSELAAEELLRLMRSESTSASDFNRALKAYLNISKED